MDVMPDRDEQFRQFQVTEMQAQTRQLARIAEGLGSIKALLVTLLCLALLGSALVIVSALLQASKYGA